MTISNGTSGTSWYQSVYPTFLKSQLNKSDQSGAVDTFEKLLFPSASITSWYQSVYPTCPPSPIQSGYRHSLLLDYPTVPTPLEFTLNITNPWQVTHTNAHQTNDPHSVHIKIIEPGIDHGQPDQHAQSVKAVVEADDPHRQHHIGFVGLNDEAFSGENDFDPSARLESQTDLDTFIDTESSDILNAMSQIINWIVNQGKPQVLNGSLEYCRDLVYEDTLEKVRENPDIAVHMGLNAIDVAALPEHRVTHKVADAIVEYVDHRMDQADSAYHQSLAHYQDATQNAANHRVAVVVAAGNEHELNEVFSTHHLGGDTNFLAQSDNVISVAAIEARPGHPDQAAPFSACGDGEYNPTIAAKGVNVPTPFGLQDGTSLAAPEVATVIAFIMQDNPGLSVSQIKQILQTTATKLPSGDPLATGAGVINPDKAMKQAQQLGRQKTQRAEQH